MKTSEDINKILDILEIEYPDAECALVHHNVFELVVAVALSAQTTDKSVNRVTPSLFKKYPTAVSLANAKQDDMEQILKQIGMYKTKSKNIIALANMLVEKFDGIVPNKYEELVSLPGVGRKTANVVLSVGFGEQRIAVDTHVFRLANRIGLARAKDVLKTEYQLMENIIESRLSTAHHSLIIHGRNVCHAKKPLCEACSIRAYCEQNI